MYKTISGWKRAGQKERKSAVRVLRKQKVKFRCQCVRCWECQDERTVTHRQPKFYRKDNYFYYDMVETPYCPACGRPKISGKGSTYGLNHTDFCWLNEKYISEPKHFISDVFLFINTVDSFEDCAKELLQVVDKNKKNMGENSCLKTNAF